MPPIAALLLPLPLPASPSLLFARLPLPPLFAAGTGGESLAVNAANVYLRLKDRLPAFLMHELERPIVRDLIGRGMGEQRRCSSPWGWLPGGGAPAFW